VQLFISWDVGVHALHQLVLGLQVGLVRDERGERVEREDVLAVVLVLEVHDAARDDATADAGSRLLEDVEDFAMSFKLIRRDLVDAVARAVGDEGLRHHGRRRERPPHELMLGVVRCRRPRRALAQGQGEVSRL
jgi:hypothetical protein